MVSLAENKSESRTGSSDNVSGECNLIIHSTASIFYHQQRIYLYPC